MARPVRWPAKAAIKIKDGRLKVTDLPCPLEHDEQKALIGWCYRNKGLYPELDLLFAIPNGAHRVKAVAVKLQAEGVKPGVPDLMLPVARGGYHGLFIEMKLLKHSDTNENQDIVIPLLRAQGYRVEVCKGCDAAIAVITDYLKGETSD